MPITLLASTICGLLFILASCQQQDETGLSGARNSPVIAELAGREFREADIDAEIAALPGQLQHLGQDPKARTEILRAMMRRYVLSRKAQDMHLDADPAVAYRIGRMRESILIQALEQWHLEHLPEPSEGAIEAYYLEHQNEFTTPEQIHARHILVSSRKQAGKIRSALRQGKDFAALASAHSRDDSNKSRGGDLNWFPRGVMVKPFEEAAFAMKKKGAISKPVKTKFGWHIIQLLGRRSASLQSREEARDHIIGALHQQSLAAWVEKNMQEAGVRIIKAEYR